jgi:hypothetical protein
MSSRKNRADLLRFGQYTNRDLAPSNKIIDDIKTLNDLELFVKRMKSKRTGAKGSENDVPLAYVDNHPMVKPIEITSIQFVFEYGDERGYSIKTLAERRPEFLIERVLPKTNPEGVKKYVLTASVEAEVIETIRKSKWLKSRIDSDK